MAVLRVFFAMGQVGANKEKLSGADQQGKQICDGNCDPWMVLIAGGCQQKNHQDQDQPAELRRIEVIPQKAGQPGHNGAVVGWAEVWIGFRFRHQVMPAVI